MTELERAWQEWRALSRADRVRFLSMFREAYAAEREAAVRRHGGGAPRAKVSRLADLMLSEADLRRRGP